MAQLRPGHDEPEPFGPRGDDRELVEQGSRPGSVQPALVRGLPAQQVPGSGPALEGRSGALPVHCYNVVENPAHIHDLNATILHCLGIDHRRLSFKFQGLDMRLTGVEEPSPIKGILVWSGVNASPPGS